MSLSSLFLFFINHVITLESYWNSQILVFLIFKLETVIMFPRILVRMRGHVHNVSAVLGIVRCWLKGGVFRNALGHMHWVHSEMNPSDPHLRGLTPLGSPVSLSVARLMASPLLNGMWTFIWGGSTDNHWAAVCYELCQVFDICITYTENFVGLSWEAMKW